MCDQVRNEPEWEGVAEKLKAALQSWYTVFRPSAASITPPLQNLNNDFPSYYTYKPTLAIQHESQSAPTTIKPI